MARKPDTPCAGGCGKLLWSSNTSLPSGKSACRPCRRAGRGPIADRACSVCGASFRPNDHKDRKQLTCSPQCGIAARKTEWFRNRPVRSCGDCPTAVTWPRIYCPTCLTARQRVRHQRKNLKRRAGGTRPMSIAELGERDRWRCHLCRKRVGRTLRHPHPRSASRDHLVPVADGGTNDPSNLALAHLDCNVRRRTGGTVQLQLVG